MSPVVSTDVVVVGMGQLGRLFAQAFLQNGRTVIPVIRGQALAARLHHDVRLVLFAVGEDSANEVLRDLPDSYLDRVVLLQNELRPSAWLSRYALADKDLSPTICIVWFEKKADKAPVEVLPSVLFGVHTQVMAAALDRLGLAHRTVLTPEELHHELCLKNLYILALNIGGLSGAATASDLLDAEFSALIDELITLEQASLNNTELTTRLDRDRLKLELNRALLADPTHACAGRSAPARLKRTLQLGQALGQSLPVCTRIFEETRS